VKTVYRVQDSGGFGPYRSNGRGYVSTLEESAMGRFMKPEGPYYSGLSFDGRCPGPWDDGLCPRQEYLFGFDSPFLAVVWFRDEIHELIELGFDIVERKAKEVKRSESGKQLIFIPADL
jgi:hypothetical protein